MISEATLSERLPEGYDKGKLDVTDMGSFYQVFYNGELMGYITKETMGWKEKAPWKG